VIECYKVNCCFAADKLVVVVWVFCGKFELSYTKIPKYWRTSRQASGLTKSIPVPVQMAENPGKGNQTMQRKTL